MTQPFDLTGRVAIVTGGNSGIGLGMARGLASAGAGVVVAARRADRNKQAVAQLSELGAEALAVEVDVRDEASIQNMIRLTVERFGRLDILINNAGTNIRRQPQDMTLDEWRTVLDTNLTSAFLCSRDAYPHLKASGHGKIVNIGSMMSIFGVPFAPAYAASKGGIVQLTKSLATAWAQDHIQVNAVLPGWIDTELTRAGREQVPEMYNRVLGRIPDGRWGEEQDMAGIAVFLASDASDYITGAAIPVDGGYASLGI
jgi:2-deoxy-D-gluconate 3-dehydrogenase